MTLPFRVFRDGVESWMVEANDPDHALDLSIDSTHADEVTVVGTTYPYENVRRVWKRDQQLPAVELGKIMLRRVGEGACLSGYGTTDPAWVGVHAVEYGDINRNGMLN